MKKIYFLLLSFCFFNGLSAQIINIPDVNFKAMLLAANSSNATASTQTPIYNADNGVWEVSSYNKIDTNNNGEIEVNEALVIKSLNIYGASISNLTGIENFTNLNTLFCEENQLTTLDVSALTNLSSLFCAKNQLSYLNVSGLTKLDQLGCETNLLTNLDVSTLSKLTYLSCFDNKLTSLDLSGINTLVTVFCEDNDITNLDLKSNLDLEYLWCQRNQLSNLDVTGLAKLKWLFFENNKISTIDLTELSELESLVFYDNKIRFIDLSNSPKIIYVEGGQNPIESIDLSQMLNLEYLWLGYTPIHSLDVSMSKKLKGMNVSGCQNLEFINLKNGSLEDLSYYEIINDPLLLNLDTRNFSNCPKLKYICGDEGELESISQKIASYNYTDCVVGGYCSFDEGSANYTIQGSNRMDSNNNGCDVLDLPFPNLKFTISDETRTGSIITDKTGDYSIKVKEGTYKLTPILENANYFSISPTSLNVTFPTDASPFIQDFCITPIASHKDLEITLIPMEVARPGFDSKYKLVYKNKGNVAQSGTVNLSFDDAVLDVVVSNPIVSSQNTNSLSWNFSDLKPFETREITFTLNVNKPTETPAVNSGTILHYTATVNSADVDENPNDNIFVLNHTVVGSLDPNDKTCLEGDVITPSLIGEYVHYLIRFENTGNYAAQNIVVKDMIDLTKFDISTLIPTSSSHPFVTKISNGNKVEFLFENINLPFEDDSNDGYLAFKIKTKSTLKVGDSFDNEANIYFDYNFPVLTNKATTKFATTLGTQDFEFSNYFKVYPIPADEVLNISAIQNVEIQSIAVYDILGQMVIALPNVKDTSKIDVSNLSSGNYFIKIKSDKGSSNMKFIKN